MVAKKREKRVIITIMVTSSPRMHHEPASRIDIDKFASKSEEEKEKEAQPLDTPSSFPMMFVS